MVSFCEIEQFKDYGKCLKITNGCIEALVTLDIGPRIISFSFVNGRNVMFSNRGELAKCSGKEFDEYYYEGAEFENFGGHRLWLSPESLPETYYPDCTPVDYETVGDTVRFTPQPQTENGVALAIEITMHPEEPEMKVEHFATNISKTEKEFALWALTVMDRGGVEIIPQNTNDTGLLANRRIVMWPYASFNDDRFFLDDRYITLAQDENADAAFKVGVDCNTGVGYYVIGDVVFKKEYNHIIDGNYPDGGVSYETYTNKTFLEFETLSELKKLQSNETATHTEMFSLYKKPCDFDRKNPKEIADFISKLK